ncbi:TPA: AAA family ATPase [Listeria monocytogenes]|uniref:ATP-dependent nuclease n=1 Tax=Listeria monocytogenes TaxID=1639 RepID=UPI00074D6B71|nr:AAA family ATPase [Listeria monocytogenes]OER13893.1 recombinase RecF [Listeria monocytogenes]UIJ48776.1 AAA family ATPase [Listeria monocytogenes]CUL32553.1 RecF/RecN/SMC protein [Listeria monocytogenes]CUL34859.1 RecF/RecN/SMC protein [Listeria monocytogenes]HAA8510299.1 recombinase RecF [Listeria monocytogenes]
MYISKLVLKNFKSFEDEHVIEFTKGINFFVGNNNSGKTTIFKAVEFLRNGKHEDGLITSGKKECDCSVEITFSGDDILEIVKENAIKKYQNFVFEENGTQNLRILRSTESIKNVYTWNNTEQKFENPTGVGTTITALFDAQFVYSDIKNEDYQDFGKTKVVGQLINAITNDFQKSKPYKKFCDAHEKTFGNESELFSILSSTSKKIQNVMTEQYGETEVEFKFGLLEMENFFKNGTILLTDNGVTTEVSNKGTGMQRALAMSIIQVYSEITNAENSKQLFFFVDEPETFLHPLAQDKLIEAFEKISKNSQVFITTHSPYLLKKYKSSNHVIKIFSSTGNEVTHGNAMNLFRFSPTWGEINYYAFGVCSVEFHNELFGYLQEKYNKTQLEKLLENDTPVNQLRKKINKLTNENAFDEYLVEKGFEQNIKYIRIQSDGKTCEQMKTLPMFIRNIIHHPENKYNKYIEEQLAESTKKMIEIITN